MILVELSGGLGNQMFEYAAGRAVAACNRQPLFLDANTVLAQDALFGRSYALGPFNVKGQLAGRTDRERLFAKPPPYRLRWAVQWMRRLIPGLATKFPVWGVTTIAEQQPFHYDPRVEERVPTHVWLRGYFQHECYLRLLRDQLLAEFTLAVPLSQQADALADEIGSCASLAVHVRQRFGAVVGLQGPEIDKAHGVLSAAYYEKALTVVRSHDPSIEKIFVFGDDLDWAREHLRLGAPATYVEGNHDYEDLVLMSRCKHQIIANSSFAWWAAWLNRYPMKCVVAPRCFMADVDAQAAGMYPEEWTVV